MQKKRRRRRCGFTLSGDFTLDVLEASRRSAWKSGWRNVQLWKEEDIRDRSAVAIAILVLVRVLDLVEIVLVELADEACEVGVLEHAGEDGFCKLVHVLLGCKLKVKGDPIGERTFTTKASPDWFHETTWWNVLSSSILRGHLINWVKY